MKIPPRKPHFFKPILPGFKNGVLIPRSFLKYLNGEKLDHAILRRGYPKWKVKINGLLFENGWANFAEDNGLAVGDFLVFRHQGHMVFDVMVFDPTTCEKAYPPSDDVNEVESENKETQIPVPKSLKDHKFNRSNKVVKGKRVMSHSEAQATSSTLGVDNPCFLSSLTPWSIKNSTLYIPLKFARSNGLSGRQCEMILRDEEERSWVVELGYEKTHVYIKRGWRHFCIGNGLKEGDTFILELIQKGKKPIMKFHPGSNKVQKGKTVMSSHSEPQTTTSTLGVEHPSFLSKVTFYSIKSSTLYIPMKFAVSNGLSKRHCEMILRDEEQRSWVVGLRNKMNQVYISCGWHQFRIESGLKEGDTFMLELIQKGKKPIMKFHARPDLKNKPAMTCFKAKTPTSMLDNPPYFVSTVKPYSVEQSMLYIPKKFARSNLSNGDNEMILRDEEQRSWPVELRDMGSYVYIGHGWTEFRMANGLKEGDAFKFELIQKGNKPIVNFHCNFSGETV